MEFEVREFEWDEANEGHIWDRHRVHPEEVEACFFNRPRKIAKKPDSEDRYYLFGQTDGGRCLFIVISSQGTRCGAPDQRP